MSRTTLARRRCALPCALATAGLPAQTLDQLREAIREATSNSRLSAFAAQMVDLSENDGIAAASLRIDANPTLEVDTYKLPWHSRLPLGDDGPELHLEAGLGYFDARMAIPDLWSGALPGSETAVRTRWEGLSGYAGTGLRLPLGPDLHLVPIVDFSLSYLENHALYGGPGAALTSSIADGILFDWHATSVTLGGALQLEHDAPLAEGTRLASLARVDVRRFDVVRSTDAAQDQSDTVARLLARTEYTRPLGLRLFAHELEGSAHFAYARFLGPTSDLAGFVDYFEVGAGLAAPIDGLAPAQALTFSGAVVFGADVRGWSLGLGVRF